MPVRRTIEPLWRDVSPACSQSDSPSFNETKRRGQGKDFIFIGNMKRKILPVILLLIVVGGIIGYRMYSMKTDDIVNQKPDVTIAAADLIKAFEKDSAAARKQYLDKVIAVSGAVTKIDTAGSVTLGGSQGSESSVVFSLDTRHATDYQKVKEGTTATLQGKCIGYEIGEEMMGLNLGTTIKMNFGGVKSGQ